MLAGHRIKVQSAQENSFRTVVVPGNGTITPGTYNLFLYVGNLTPLVVASNTGPRFLHYRFVDFDSADFGPTVAYARQQSLPKYPDDVH